MYVVTNREVYPRRQGLDVFGDTPNELGPNELRLVRVTKTGAGYETEVIPDKRLTRTELRELQRQFDLRLDMDRDWYPSFRAACEIFERARREQRHVLAFVHGYNNDMRDVLNTAEALESFYNVIVVPFSWPANGGGVVSGTTAYLDDKRDARVSMDALNRFIGLVHSYYEILTESYRLALWERAVAQDQDRGNRVAIQERYTRLLADACGITVNLLCHSMAAYVLKYALRPGDSEAAKLTFDNISLVAADANNEGHADWAGRIQVRNRLLIVINEDDFALEWSRRKPGDEQLARLGQYLRNLTAKNAFYIDVTNASGVGNAHGYYLGMPVEQNADLKAMFTAAFEGGRPEERLRYAADLNAYQVV